MFPEYLGGTLQDVAAGNILAQGRIFALCILTVLKDDIEAAVGISFGLDAWSIGKEVVLAFARLSWRVSL